MTWPFKLFGLLMIFSAASLSGFMKSMQLKQRYKKLCQICRSLGDLKERIRLNSGEISRLIAQCFGALAAAENGSFKVNEYGLEKEDIALINEFFHNIGMSDTAAECERAELYISLISKKCSEAEQKCKELCRLYNSIGILGGIFICIFFL